MSVTNQARLNELGRSLIADPHDAALTARWTRTVVDLLPANELMVIDHLDYLVGRIQGSKIEAVVLHQLALGRDRIARHLLSRLARANRSSHVVLLQHNLALHMGAPDLAERLGREVADRGFVGETVATGMAARRALAAYRPEQAVAVLGAVPDDNVQQTMLLLTALRSIGRHDRVLAELDATAVPITPTLTGYRYEALLAVGELDAAEALAASLGVDDLAHAPTFAVRQSHAAGSADAHRRLVDDVRALEERDGPSAAVVQAYAELGSVDDLDRIEAAVDRADLAPASVVALARLHYRRGHYDLATELLDRLSGFDDRWDAETLRVRIMTETGRSAEAVARQWPRTGTVHTQLDDAIHHALLREHRFTDAFRVASPWRQKQVAALFGERAGNGEDPPHVRSRFVVNQSRPEDEIIAAAAYAELASHSDELVVTCDPGLLPVMRRSFPQLTFVAVPRLRPRAASFVGPDAPARPENTQYEELTAEAYARAAASDDVVLSRLLQHRALVSKKRGAAKPYLVPDPRLAAELATRLPTGPTVGLAWRRESSSTAGDLESLTVADLAPLADPTGPTRSAGALTFVCLQADVTDGEREALRRLSDGRVWFPDEAGLDLRDDAETTLALTAGLTAVVGVATAVVELAAAGGTPTVLVATSHMVAWRAMDARGHDFWHDSARVAVADDLTDRETLVGAAAVLLGELLRARGRPRSRSRRWRTRRAVQT